MVLAIKEICNQKSWQANNQACQFINKCISKEVLLGKFDVPYFCTIFCIFVRFRVYIHENFVTNKLTIFVIALGGNLLSNS